MLKRGSSGFFLLSAMLALSSVAAVCVTSGGRGVQQSDSFEITRDAVIEVNGDVSKINVTTANVTEIRVDTQLKNFERITYSVSPQGGTPATVVKVQALINPDLRLRASAVINIAAPPSANIMLRSGLGDINITGPRTGDVTALAVNGRITVRGSAGSYNLETVNGEIKVVDLDGPIHALTRNGSINVSGRLPANSGSTMETRNGDINVTLPAVDDLRLNGLVLVGRIEAGEFARFDKTRHVVEGKLGPGTAGLDARAKNGTIRIKTGTADGPVRFTAAN